MRRWRNYKRLSSTEQTTAIFEIKKGNKKIFLQQT
jgi:hypothetical protein